MICGPLTLSDYAIIAPEQEEPPKPHRSLVEVRCYRSADGVPPVKRPLAVLAALALVIAAAAAFAAPASAQEGQAMLRFAHLSLDADPVDVYVDGEPVLTNIAFRVASEYVELPPGQHDVSVAPAGSPAGGPALASLPMNAAAGASTVGLFGPDGDFSLAAFTDDFTSPPSGQVKIRAIHAGIRTNADAVDVFANGQPLFTNLSFQQATQYMTLPGGTAEVEVRAAGTEAVLVSGGQVNMPAGAVITFAGVGSGDTAYEFLPLLDAAGAAQAPTGGVATGAGGTARTWPALLLAGAGVLVAGATLALGLAHGRRRAGWDGRTR